VSTLHSYGFAAVRRAFGSVKLDEHKVDRIIRALVGEEPETREYRAVLRRVVGLAKGVLAQREDVEEMAYAADVEDEDVERFCADVWEVLTRCKADTKTIDFDDMVWFPVVFGLRCKRYDRVFIDETQDLNACQIKLALSACARHGRIFAVGDDRQAIYGFRGADANAVGRVISELNAKVLPLSVTYRCARRIVEVANAIVPDLQAAENAVDGEVLPLNEDLMRKQAMPGDFILSRVNAPLVGLCLGFLKEGRPATVAGRDGGAGLRSLVVKSKANTVIELTEWLGVWREREVARITRRNPEASTVAVDDRVACIDALCEGATYVSEVIAKIETLFSDTNLQNRIVCSSTHKAKGLERTRVFVLKNTYRPAQGLEEANLWYVAVTRARETLFVVS
jgi:superfamily I DNA/RNA helicase